jgi:hypothetical protein
VGLVTIAVLWAGYSFIVVGWDKLTSGCGSVPDMLWPKGCGNPQLHVKCAGTPNPETNDSIPTSTAAVAQGNSPHPDQGGVSGGAGQVF